MSTSQMSDFTDFAAPTIISIQEIPEVPLIINEHIRNYLSSTTLDNRSLKHYIQQNLVFVFTNSQDGNLKDFWVKMFETVANATSTEVNMNPPNWSQIRQKYIDHLLNVIQRSKAQQWNSANDSSMGSNSITPTTTTTTAQSTGPQLLDATAWREFEVKYKKMNEDKKFLVSASKKLENIVYDVGLSYQEENLAHSFIVDLNDFKYVKHLSYEEIVYVATYQIRDIPPTNDLLAKAMLDCSAMNFDDALVYAKQQMVHLKTKDVQYGFFLGLTHAMNNFEMGIYDDPTLSETDIMLKLWVHLLDIQFDFDPFFKCHRGEITSKSSAKRKLEQMADNDRKPLGKRADLLVVDQNDDEYGYGEASKITDENANKNINDTKLKTNKTMRGMLAMLVDKVKHDDDSLKQIRSVGYQCSRYTLTVMVMDCVLGYTARLRRLPPVSLDLTPANFVRSFCDLFTLANKALLICRDSASIVNSAPPPQRPNFDEFELPRPVDPFYVPSVLKSPPRPVPTPRTKKQKTSHQ